MITAPTAIVLLSFLLSGGQGQEKSANLPESANVLARQILTHEAKAEAEDHSHWLFRLETQKGPVQEVDEVVETTDGDLQRRIALNGRPLTVQQERDEDKRIQKLIHNPEALRKAQKDQNEDSDRSQRLLTILPKALTFSYAERQGERVKLHFTPNPQFQPSSREARVMQALEGDMWVESKQQRLEEIAGHLQHEVKFGGGWLGHLNAGGQFKVKQAEVAPGFWELTLLDVDMKGKALFFKTIGVEQLMRRSNFRRVSDDLTLPQAANILREQPGDLPASAARKPNE